MRTRIAIAVVAIAVAVAVVLWLRRSASETPAQMPSPTQSHIPAQHVRKIDRAQRAELVRQIAAAREHARARIGSSAAPATTTTATSTTSKSERPELDDTIALEQVSGTVKTALEEAIPILADCYHGETGKTAAVQMVLYSDPSVGTVIDTPAMTDGDGAPLSRELDDCLRGAIEALELPPLEAGGHLPLQYSFKF